MDKPFDEFLRDPDALRAFVEAGELDPDDAADLFVYRLEQLIQRTLRPDELTRAGTLYRALSDRLLLLARERSGSIQ